MQKRLLLISINIYQRYPPLQLTPQKTSLANETRFRSDADTLEQKARSNADGTLQTNINTEAKARADADTLLTDNLNTEITTRTNQYNTLSASIPTGLWIFYTCV